MEYSYSLLFDAETHVTQQMVLLFISQKFLVVIHSNSPQKRIIFKIDFFLLIL
jgi:hypothetical protein